MADQKIVSETALTAIAKEIRASINDTMLKRNVSGAICTFAPNIEQNLPSVLVNVVATGGNGTPSTPIAINGYTVANITRCGVNLWNEQWEVGVITSDGSIDSSQTTRRTTSYIPVKSGTNVYLVCPNSALNGRYAYYDSAKTLVNFNGNGFANNNITIPSDVAYLRITLGSGYNTTYNNDISINYPSTATTYHAYNGNTYTIAFGQTVYGGVLDVTSGKLTVTHEEIDSYNGESINEPWLSSKDVYTEGGTPTTGAQVVYPLTTPIEIDLTPVQIRALVGTNNVFGDTNGDTEVEYLDKIESITDLVTEITGTLTAGTTSITLSDASITTSSTIDVYTDTFGVNPTNISVATGSVTLTFASQASNLGVKVRIS